MPVAHHDLANAIRFLAIDAVEAANSGHPGMPMGMADVATVLFSRFLKVDPTEPDWPDRDRFVLSAGHGSMLLYALSYLTGYKLMTLEQLKNFRQLGSLTPGHPEHDLAIGVETTTGPLGQGIATSVGMALVERIQNARFGDGLVNHYTYVIASDGDLMEGISHEAASLAGHYGLSRLIVLYDDNNICIDGPTSLSFSDDTAKRFEAYGWAVQKVDGHDPEAVAAAITAAQKSDKPNLICCRTTIGFGAPTKAGTAATHGSPLGKDEVAGARMKLNWPHAPFEIPAEILAAWHSFGARNEQQRLDWQKRLAASPHKAAFEQALLGPLPAAVAEAIDRVKLEAATQKPKVATRQASGTVLSAIVPLLPELIGGSADLTPSNNTKTKDSPDISKGNYGGRYMHWGIREHGMAAAMNGMALHGGIIPYSGTFLSFTDYCRPAIRLAALMRQRVIYVMTHDSIGLGEDGPTHQPVEHLAALRAMPGVQVLRPCDTVETAECWDLALNYQGPTVLALSRQALPTLRITPSRDNQSAKGGYVLAEGTHGPRRLTLVATGSEVHLAAMARDQLEAEGVSTALVSLPCFSRMSEQPKSYQDEVFGTAPCICVEAGVKQGWDEWLLPGDVFVGMSGYGASAPAEKLYAHFGITAEAIVAKGKKLLQD